MHIIPSERGLLLTELITYAVPRVYSLDTFPKIQYLPWEILFTILFRKMRNKLGEVDFSVPKWNCSDLQKGKRKIIGENSRYI
ncbi:hypothetical protein CIPAW_08G028000 [Carya illinoinensis]|uniref:Uncharacterized protein n=1 Tax=Carya illinoinensis TaxID=32201 RepID=A0A8T1PQS2_CARIL|nr:hypothetical protein CIPAW_08G028000 [Carya illinoinensis]